LRQMNKMETKTVATAMLTSSDINVIGSILARFFFRTTKKIKLNVKQASKSLHILTFNQCL
jgi:hypothetical protein